MTIGVAAGANKIAPICAALRGNHLKALVLDEATANGVLETMSK
jgi:DNA-binding transcriptional regulator LsrR (DeoR family)